MTITAGHQPVYLPSLGYFALMKRSDIFVHCSHLQFVRKSWHHRNYIKEGTGRLLLTIPISHAGHPMPLYHAMYEGDAWKSKHLRSIQQAYGRSPFFDQYYPAIKQILGDYHSHSLANLNIALIARLAEWLGLSTPIVNLLYVDKIGDAIDKIIDICESAEANIYLSKPGAAEYIGPEEEKRLADVGIKHVWLNDWKDPDEKPLSAIHHLFTLGPDAQGLL